MVLNFFLAIKYDNWKRQRTADDDDVPQAKRSKRLVDDQVYSIVIDVSGVTVDFIFKFQG